MQKNINFEEQLVEEAAIRAVKEGRTFADLVRQAVAEYLKTPVRKREIEVPKGRVIELGESGNLEDFLGGK